MESALEQLTCQEDARESLVMAVREAVINAMRHGNREAPGKRVELALDRGPAEIVARVSDEGRGFDPESVPDPTAPENLFKPNGRGILLMRRFVDSVEYSFPHRKGTVVTLRKRIAGVQEETTE